MKKRTLRIEPYTSPAGGWGALDGIRKAFTLHRIPLQRTRALFKANHDRGFDCPGCAWPDRNDGKAIDACENGMKAVAAEMTARLATPDFFARHPLTVLRKETDFELEDHGRIAHPLFYDAPSDTYQAISWERAFWEIGQKLRELDPHSVAFYASGRSSNETAFLWQLFARSYGTNNLPDSSNLCHEPSGYAMKVRMAEAVGMTLIAFARGERFSCFAHAERIDAHSPAGGRRLG